MAKFKLIDYGVKAVNVIPEVSISRCYFSHGKMQATDRAGQITDFNEILSQITN